MTTPQVQAAPMTPDAAAAAIITQLYAQYFGRAPDAGGLKYWTDQLVADNNTYKVAQNIYNAAVGLGETPKVDVSTAATNVLQATPPTNTAATIAGAIAPPVSYTGPVYTNDAWGTRTQSPYSYITPWQTQQNGVQMADGKIWFPNPTNARIGTADVSYGFATDPNQIGDAVTTKGNSPKIGQAPLDFIKNYVTQNVDYNGQQGFTVPADKVGYLDAGNGVFVQTDRNNSKYAAPKKGNLFGALLTAASLIPGMQWLAPIAAGYGVVEGIATGNWGEAIGSALGFSDVAKFVGLDKATSLVQSTLGVSTKTAAAITNAAVGGTIAGLTGGDVLKAAAISGGVAYLSPSIKDALSKVGITTDEQLEAAVNNTNQDSTFYKATANADGSFSYTDPQTGQVSSTIGPMPGVSMGNVPGANAQMGLIQPFTFTKDANNIIQVGGGSYTPPPSLGTSPIVNGPNGTVTTTGTPNISTAPANPQAVPITPTGGTVNNSPASGTTSTSTTTASGTTASSGGISLGNTIPAVVGAITGALGSGSTSTTSEKTPWSAAVPYLMNVLNMENSNLGGYVPFKPEDLVAGLNQNQNMANAQGLNTAYEQQAYANQIAQALQPYATGQMLDPAKNPYAQAALDATLRKITQQYQTAVLPSIQGTAVQTGGVGGSRQAIAQALASRDYLQNVSDTTATTNNNLYNLNYQQMLSAQNQLPNVFTWQQQPFTIGNQIGSQQQTVDQNTKNAAWQIWQAQQAKQQNAANTISQIGGQGSAQTTEYPGQNPLVAAISGAVAGSQLGKILS